MNFEQTLEAINLAETKEAISELKNIIALSCDNSEITEQEFTELRELCELSKDLLPSEHAQRQNEREDLERTYYQQTKF